MIRYQDVKDNAAVFLSMTSLTVAEFQILCTFFDAAWEEHFGSKKSPEPTGPGRRPYLKTIEDNLFFILFYIKLYPLQTIIGFLFGLSQSRANEIIHDLTAVLCIALENMNCMPERDPQMLSVYLAEEEQNLSLDGTERRIERPSDYDTQKLYYSGKKKSHTVKQVIVCGNNDRKVKYLGDVHEGKKHDKKIADEEKIKFTDGTVLFQDSGLQGYHPEGVEVIQPVKKPRGGELTEEQKEGNRLISSVRVVVEHVIAGVKRLHIVKDIFRNKKENYEDVVMAVACALHNFRTDCRLHSY